VFAVIDNFSRRILSFRADKTLEAC
jgi:hypothetical protein